MIDLICAAVIVMGGLIGLIFSVVLIIAATVYLHKE